MRLMATLQLEMGEIIQINIRASALYLPILLLMLLKTGNGKKCIFTSLTIDYINPDKSKVSQKCEG